MSEATVHIAHRQINCTMMLKTPTGGHVEIHGQVATGFDVPCILDTGAMNACINDQIMRQIGFKPIGTTHVGGANGSAVANVYEAEIGIKGLTDFWVKGEVIGLPTRTALLGYNVFIHLDAIQINCKDLTVQFYYNDKMVTH